MAGGNATGTPGEVDPTLKGSNIRPGVSATLSGSEPCFRRFRWRCHRLLNLSPSATGDH